MLSVAVALLLAVPVACRVWRAWFSPLASVPAAHPLCRYSAAWIRGQTLLSRRNSAIHLAHQRLGPIVQLAPDEISVSSAEGIKTIYGGAWPKDPWYNVFHNFGVPPMFSLLSAREHTQRKRLFAHMYSNSSVSSSQMLSSLSSTILPELLSQFSSGEAEVHEIFDAFAMDVITSFLFTPSNSAGFLTDPAKRKRFQQLYHSRRHFFPLSSELPGLLGVLKRLGIRLIPRWVDAANNEIEGWCQGLCEARATTLYSSSKKAGATPESKECVYDRLLAAGVDAAAAQSEALDHIGAGHETTALALSFTLTALSSRPDLQRRLRASLEGSLEQRGQWRLPNSYKALEANTILEAIAKESLRLYAPIPGSQRRLVPDGGAELSGVQLPPGTRVGAQAWSIHRSQVFSSPSSSSSAAAAAAAAEDDGGDVDAFRPERWLESTPDKLHEMERHWWAFGSGGRGCIGRWLAVYELKMVLAAVYANFETSLGSGNVGVVMEDRYTTSPAGGRGVWIRFEPVLAGEG